MANYYDNTEKYRALGIDYDLVACLEYNPQGGFTVEDIAEVHAVEEGEKDGEDWAWVLGLRDGRFVYLQGGCDYTGWDSQSWANSQFASSAMAAAALCGKVRRWNDEDFAKAHLVSLLLQVKHGKDTTWRERMDKEFGLVEDDADA